MDEIIINRLGIEVHRLNEGHIDEILALMNREGWYYYDRHELLRYIELNQDCFTLLRNGKVSGSIFTTNYGNQSWIGNVVIAEEARGEGLAVALIRGVIATLQNKQIQTFRLGSLPLAIGVYKKVGFHAESFTSSQEAALPLNLQVPEIGKDHPFIIERLTADDLNDVVALDAQFFRSDRRQLLSRLFEDSIREASLALKVEGRLEGFLMVRRRQSSKVQGHFAEGPDYVYRVGPACVLPKHGIAGFEALFEQAIRIVNQQVSQLQGSARIYIVFPKAAERAVIYNETRALAEVMGMDVDMNLDLIFGEHAEIFGASHSSKSEEQWCYLQGLGFHQEYFEQVMVYTSDDIEQRCAEHSRVDPEGIFALATPGDKG